MVLNILANAGILLIAIYSYFKLNNSTTQYRNYTLRQRLFYIVCVSVVGMALMYQSVVIAGVRFDFRLLLFAVTTNYLGWEITVPSMMILTLGRFVFGQDNVSCLNILMQSYFIVSLPLLQHYIQRYSSRFTQLFILLTNNIVAMCVVTIILLEDPIESFQILVVFTLFNYLLLVLSHLMIEDLRSMVVKINQDCLTNLNNQRRFHEDLQVIDEINKKVTIGILDIDHFKAYNDSLGHEVGDIILKRFAKVLLRHVSPLTNVYRVGGEEFAMIIVDQEPNVAEQKIEALHQAINEMEIIGIAETPVKPTASIGVAHIKKGETAKEAFRRADSALYYSKNNGRNQVQISTQVSQAVHIKSL